MPDGQTFAQPNFLAGLIGPCAVRWPSNALAKADVRRPVATLLFMARALIDEPRILENANAVRFVQWQQAHCVSVYLAFIAGIPLMFRCSCMIQQWPGVDTAAPPSRVRQRSIILFAQ
jgi:hypothetical protein